MADYECKFCEETFREARHRSPLNAAVRHVREKHPEEDPQGSITTI